MSVHMVILGCGAIARRHSRVARSLDGRVRLSYASRARERAEAYRRRFGGVSAFGSYEEACADPSVDAVFDCTPHAFRVAHAQLAARHRKHLLMEKPVARSLAELATIESAVAEAGVFAMVAENYYFKPLLGALREHLRRGDIGDPLIVELNRVGRGGGFGWRTDAAMMGGGALLEGGVHWVNLLLELGGVPTSVIAAQPERPYAKRAPTEDSVEVLVKFAGGAVGKLLHSWHFKSRVGGLSMSRLFGTDGTIHFESNGLFALVLGRRRRLRMPGLHDLMGFRAMLRHFVEAIERGTPPEMSLAVARRDLAVVLAAYRSLESGRFESVGVGEAANGGTGA